MATKFPKFSQGLAQDQQLVVFGLESQQHTILKHTME